MRQGNPRPCRAGERKGRAHRHVGEVGGPGEGPFSPEQEHQLAVALHPHLSGQWQHQPLELPAGDQSRLTRCQGHDVQTRVFPAGLTRPNGNLEACTARRPYLAMPLTHNAPPWTSSAAARLAAETSFLGICCSPMRSSTSCSVGMAVEHSNREATMAPATLAKLITRCNGQPANSPLHSAPPKASPAPRPLTTSTGKAATSSRWSRVRASTPLGPLLITASSIPRSSSASAARSGSPSPTATSHSALLPTATVTIDKARSTWA